MDYREETDAMGTMLVPEDAYYGPQTQRAVDNFPVSNLAFPPEFLHGIVLIKKMAAIVNCQLGRLDEKRGQAIKTAAQEILDGGMADQFVVDVFQTGSGTSTNMNVNEVVASRANEILTGKRGGKAPVHPNDHVNLGQSSNDVIPSALHIGAFTLISRRLMPSLRRLCDALKDKAIAFKDVKKLGRTHLQDAVPMTLGNEFSGYARQIELGIRRIISTQDRLSELALGGTAVGSGLNTHRDFAARVCALVSDYTKLPFREATNHFEAQAAQDAGVEASGALKTVSVSLLKIANDIRWLSSGPRAGIGEITIPSLQPGSSIMPGKVNPVIPEMVIQVAYQVIGNDGTIALAGQSGNFELNVTLPVLTYNLFQSILLLSTSTRIFADKCIEGIEANRERSFSNIEKSLALVTGLVPHLGYDKAAAIAKKAYETGKTVRQVVLEEGVLDESVFDRILENSA